MLQYDSVDAGLLIVRVLVGVPFSMHGFQKLFGWFGGGGFNSTAAWFKSLGFGTGSTAAALAGGCEVGGGIGLALGMFTPFSAMAVAATMTTAAFVNNREGGFWSLRKGWELNGYLIAVAISLAVSGPGDYSIDAVLGTEGFRGAAGGALALVGIAAGWIRWVSRQRVLG